MAEIGIGLIGGGYMGKAHAVAMSAVGAVFDTELRPQLKIIAASSAESAECYRSAFGFSRAAVDWQEVVASPDVDAVIIASPQSTHRAVAEAMVATAEASGCANMIGFNYVRTPATQFARKLLAEAAIGDVTWFRGEHTEDFLADPDIPANWRTSDRSTGAMGDLAPHMINCALALLGPIEALSAQVETVHATRPGADGPVAVQNDDQAQMMVRFASGVMGHIYISRTATGRKMGYAYEIHGTKGALRFDQEDQNALWLYRAEGPEATRGFAKILTGPSHPDYLPFCQGPGHGTGYQEQIIIEARDFLQAIASGEPVWPTFREGLAVARVVETAFASTNSGRWESVSQD